MQSKSLALNLKTQIYLLCLCIFLVSCSTVSREEFELTQQESAEVVDFESVRFFADDLEFAYRFAGHELPNDQDEEFTILALSGGAGAGAYGAGVLSGWSKSGKRPEFDVVTGVSTGALMAPFAFLGSKYDDDLIQVFTSGVAKELARVKFPISGLLSNSILKGAPLQRLVSKYVDLEFINEVAQAHGHGRRLLVVTTNLDAQKSVIWDMGAIAESRNHAAVELFRKVLVASASVPAIYPAVRIPVMSDGERFEELHSDGGVIRQLFLVPDALLLDNELQSKMLQRKRTVFIIVNNEFSPQFEMVRDRTFSVASRAYATLLKSSTESTIKNAYSLALKGNIDFNMSYINTYVPYNALDPFNKDYMNKVFDLGFEKGLNNNWIKQPPLGEYTKTAAKSK